MTRGEILLQASFYVAPAIALFAAVYFFTNKWFEIQKDKLKLQSIEQSRPVIEQKKSSLNKDFLPMQVDAYQRLVLFLERIAPNNMIMRLNNPGLPAGAFQAKLIETIRQEYEHNLAQQIFVSADAWKLTNHTKEEILKIINMAGTQLAPTAMANDLARGVFEITAQLDKQPTDGAIAFLKEELNGKLAL